MKIAPNLIICAILSISIGIAVATPLMASELEIKPWKTQIQGPTAHFNSDTVYANFTTKNADTPITTNSGPTINYQVVLNITNPSDYAAKLTSLFFSAGKTVTNTTGQGLLGNTRNWSSSGGFEAKGAWVDGVWYNLTYVNGAYPNFDENGTMTQSPSNSSSSTKGYWMEGVQGYERTVHTDAGTKSYTYLNMNGTWTDVTGRITVEREEASPTYMIPGVLANQNLLFQRGANVSIAAMTAVVNGNGEVEYIKDPNPPLKGIDTGEGGFDNLFAPHESRLIVIQGTYEARSYNTNANPVTTLQSGLLSVFTMTHNAVDINPVIDNRTYMKIWSDDTVVHQIRLTHIGNSYVYNVILGDNQQFQFDKSGAEATIVPRS